MKRIIILLAMTIVVLTAWAQTPTNNPQIDEVDALCQQVDSLTQRIKDKYETYTNDMVYYDQLYKTDWRGRSVQEKTFKGLEDTLKELRMQIKEKNDSIQFIIKEIQKADTLLQYYASHNLDEMFDAINFQTLETHRKLLNVMDKPVPKAVNDLQVMLECADLLNQGYNEKANKECLNQLKNVPDCTKKKELQKLLETHSAVTNETNAWMGKDQHTLYELMAFRKYLKDYYEVDMEKHYPFLAEKARMTVGFKTE